MGSHPWTLTGPSGRSPSPSRQVGVTPEHSDTSLALLKETGLEQGCALTASRKDKTPAKLQQSSMSCGKYTQKVRLLGNKTETSPASSQPGCPASWLGNFLLIYRSGRAPECREHRDYHGNSCLPHRRGPRELRGQLGVCGPNTACYLWRRHDFLCF